MKNGSKTLCEGRRARSPPIFCRFLTCAHSGHFPEVWLGGWHWKKFWKNDTNPEPNHLSLVWQTEVLHDVMPFAKLSATHCREYSFSTVLLANIQIQQTWTSRGISPSGTFRFQVQYSLFLDLLKVPYRTFLVVYLNPMFWSTVTESGTPAGVEFTLPELVCFVWRKGSWRTGNQSNEWKVAHAHGYRITCVNRWWDGIIDSRSLHVGANAESLSNVCLLYSL